MAVDLIARNRLRTRLDAALAALPAPAETPTMVVDLDAFDANAADHRRLRRGARLLPARAVAARAGRQRRHPGGVPQRRGAALARLVSSPAAAATVTIGPKRSPLADAAQVVALAEQVVARPGFSLVGVMTYEGQVAGVQDDVPGQRARSLVVRRIKATSVDQLRARRHEIDRDLRKVASPQFWNAGGSGSLESSAADQVVTEVSAGSGLLVPGLFDHYQAFRPRPAAYFGVPAVRRPSPSMVTVAGGGFVASGPAGEDRLPVPWAPPGLHLTGLEGAGEAQTPLSGNPAGLLRIGDLVWFRHAKSGELFEHTNRVHLVAGASVVDTVPTYRGLGGSFG